MTARGGAPNTPPNGPAPSQIQSAPNLVAFDPKLAVPSQPLYLQRNDLIVFNVLTNGAGITMRVNYRWLTPAGEIQEGEFDTAQFTGTTIFSFGIYEGWLLSFAARVTSGGVLGQWTFLQALITRASNPSFQSPMHALFWSGFVYSFTSNGWPGLGAKEVADGPGVIRTITGAAPLAGFEISETVPPQRRWILLALRAQLTTSATVANRSPAILYTDGANTFTRGQSYFQQAASLAIFYSAAINPPGAAPTNGDQIATSLLPMPLKVGFQIKTNTLNLQAGDQWTAPQYVVLEWGQWDS